MLRFFCPWCEILYGPILNIMYENDLNMIDLVITHLTHPWGPLWTLETLGDRWRSLATLGDMLENDHLGGNWSFYRDPKK